MGTELSDLVVAIVQPRSHSFTKDDAEYLLEVVRTLLAEEMDEEREVAEMLLEVTPLQKRPTVVAQAEAFGRAAAIIRGQAAA